MLSFTHDNNMHFAFVSQALAIIIIHLVYFNGPSKKGVKEKTDLCTMSADLGRTQTSNFFLTKVPTDNKSLSLLFF